MTRRQKDEFYATNEKDEKFKDITTQHTTTKKQDERYIYSSSFALCCRIADIHFYTLRPRIQNTTEIRKGSI